jgi:hypothetical protein
VLVEQPLQVVLPMETLVAQQFMEWLLLAVALQVVEHQLVLLHQLWVVAVAVGMLIHLVLAVALHQA